LANCRVRPLSPGERRKLAQVRAKIQSAPILLRWLQRQAVLMYECMDPPRRKYLATQARAHGVTTADLAFTALAFSVEALAKGRCA